MAEQQLFIAPSPPKGGNPFFHSSTKQRLHLLVGERAASLLQQNFIAVAHYIHNRRLLHQQCCCTQRIYGTKQSVAQIHDEVCIPAL
ncbi:hypothetical protein D3C81_1382640 [compost metagenome]